MKPELGPLFASTVTALNGDDVMKAKLEFKEKTILRSGTFSNPKKPEVPPTPINSPPAPRPDGLLVFAGSAPVIAPLILTSEGEKEIVSVEFPDDLDELDTIKSGWKIKRRAPDSNGSFIIEYSRGEGARYQGSTFRYAKDGKILSMSLFGKFEAIPAD